MKEKIINIKNKISSFFKKLIDWVKSNFKKFALICGATLIAILAIVFIVISVNKANISNGNLSNFGFLVGSNNNIYYLGYKDGKEDGIYKIKGDQKEKISGDYGYYMNKVGNRIYYFNPADNSIVKMKTDGQDREIIVENVTDEVITVKNNYIYYFANGYFYRAKTDGNNKKRISNKSIENYQIVGDLIYYSYKENGKYTIAKMKTDGEKVQKVDEDCGKAFFVNHNKIYYISENADSENKTIKYELCVVKTNGKNKQKLADIEGKINIATVNFDKTDVYYVKENQDGEDGIYKLGLNGKDELKIVDIQGYTTRININSGYVYYPDEDENKDIQIFKIKTNGKGEKEEL